MSRSAGQADGELMNFLGRLSSKWVVRHVRLGSLSSLELGHGETYGHPNQCGGTRTNPPRRQGVPARRCETREGSSQRNDKGHVGVWLADTRQYTPFKAARGHSLLCLSGTVLVLSSVLCLEQCTM